MSRRVVDSDGEVCTSDVMDSSPTSPLGDAASTASRPAATEAKTELDAIAEEAPDEEMAEAVGGGLCGSASRDFVLAGCGQ